MLPWKSSKRMGVAIEAREDLGIIEECMLMVDEPLTIADVV
jgi:hypothetical protein